MKVIVTGGAGFIGSHLINRLLNKGNEIVCLDNLRTGSLKNIEHFRDNPLFHFKEHDVIDPYDIKADCIYNLACPASPVHYQKDPVNTMNSTVEGVRNAVNNALKYSIPLLQSSTSEIYGDPLEHPQSEDYWGNVNPLGPRACYNEAKRLGETLMYNYHEQYGLDMRIVRIFNTYGPNMQMNDGRVISNFIIQALQNEDITIYGDGTQTRSFCYVDDMIDGLIKMMESSVHGPVNIGNDNETTILELARKVIELCKSLSNISFKALPEEDPRRRKPDLQLAKEVLNWQPRVSLDEGLKRTIEYFRSLFEH
ncbi:MAG: UDP-glucuronic acid decarboxylase family protein [candidate division WOR-3 bacterium]|nr:UDP-glucuronic acid decarboxylase family protein [candidate division WOR-3 bacterium]